MAACVPDSVKNPPTFRSRNAGQTQKMQRERILVSYDMSTKSISLCNMPFRSNAKSGFLNTQNNAALIATQSCGSLHQCFMARFTWNGATKMLTTGPITTPDRTISGGSLYKAQDAFTCGIFAIYNKVTEMCEIDKKVVPLYQYFCVQGASQVCRDVLGVT